MFVLSNRSSKSEAADTELADGNTQLVTPLHASEDVFQVRPEAVYPDAAEAQSEPEVAEPNWEMETPLHDQKLQNQNWEMEISNWKRWSRGSQRGSLRVHGARRRLFVAPEKSSGPIPIKRICLPTHLTNGCEKE